MSTAADIRRTAEFEVTCRSGRSYRLVRPVPSDYVICGASTLPFLASAEFTSTMTPEEVAASMAQRVKTPEDVAALLAMQDRVLERLMIEPRYFAGHVADCPDDRVCRHHIGDDFDEINAALGRTADGGSGGETAAAVRRFRADGGGEDSGEGGPVLPGAPVSDAVGVAG